VLSVEGGPLNGQRHTLLKDATLGRQPGNDIVLDDSGVSRRHASFAMASCGQWTVTDLGSSNGTRVNGEPIAAPTPLSPGDTVQAGATVLRVLQR
jgi:pSer/pThr/pTyr-binding forkhead associated (FHA) protein